jgi:ArsR family transcriptional regulator
VRFPGGIIDQETATRKKVLDLGRARREDASGLHPDSHHLALLNMPTMPRSPLPFQKACQLFRLLGEEMRLRMLLVLAEHGELCVSALCDEVGYAQPAVSHHLALLRAGGVVGYRRVGQRNFYSIASDRVRSWLRGVARDGARPKGRR